MTATTWRRALPGLSLAVGGAVLLVVITSDQVGRLLPFNFGNRGADFRALYAAAHSMVGLGGPNPYRVSPPLFYPAPLVLPVAPLGFLDASTALAVARAVAALCLAGVVWGWRQATAGTPWSWALLLTLPAVSLVYLGQLPTALGLAAFSLAVAAQRAERWWLCGALVAIGLLRLGNAPPLLTMLAVGIGPRPRAAAWTTTGVLSVLIPLTLFATLWSPQWFSDYRVALGAYTFSGPVWAAAQQAAGLVGVAVLQVLAMALAVLVVRRSLGRPLDLDRSALVIGLTTVSASFPAAYAAVFAIPALLRASRFRRLAWLVPGAVVIPWALTTPPAQALGPAYVLAPLAEVLLLAAAASPLLRAKVTA